MPTNTELTDCIEALGEVTPDGAPLALTWADCLERIRDLSETLEYMRDGVRKGVALADLAFAERPMMAVQVACGTTAGNVRAELAGLLVGIFPDKSR
jgi:hypothetical protein